MMQTQKSSKCSKLIETEDKTSVKELPDVSGMRHNVFPTALTEYSENCFCFILALRHYRYTNCEIFFSFA